MSRCSAREGPVLSGEKLVCMQVGRVRVAGFVGWGYLDAIALYVVLYKQYILPKKVLSANQDVSCQFKKSRLSVKSAVYFVSR